MQARAQQREWSPVSRELNIALVDIYDSVISRVASRNRSKMFSYDELADIAGDVADWRCGGRFRDALSGLDARQWLVKQFRMYWRADPMQNGLEFTCCQLTGMYWEQDRASDVSSRYGAHLRVLAPLAGDLMPSFRDHFRDIGKAGARMVKAAQGLDEVSGARRMRMLGVVVSDEGNA